MDLFETQREYIKTRRKQKVSKLFSVLFGSAMTCKNKTTLKKKKSSRKNKLFDDNLQLLCTRTKFQYVPLGSLVEIPFISCTT